MEITESVLHGIPFLALRGRLDGLSAPAVEEKVATLLSSGATRLVFDCSGIEYASSAGLRVFLSAAKKNRASAHTGTDNGMGARMFARPDDTRTY